MRGSFEVAASPCFCSLGFLTVAFLYLLPSTAARAPRQPRPALSVFVCFMAASFVPVDDPFPQLSVPLRSSRSAGDLPSPTNLLALSSVSSSSSPPLPALRGPTYGIVAALLRARATFYNLVQPSWGSTDLRRCWPSPRAPKTAHICTGRVLERCLIFFSILFNLPHLSRGSFQTLESIRVNSHEFQRGSVRSVDERIREIVCRRRGFFAVVNCERWRIT